MRTAESVLFDVLAAGARRAVGVDLEVRRVDRDVGDRIGLRHHRDRAGRGVDAALRLRLRHALHAMAARLELELRVDVVAGDARDRLAVAAQFRRRSGDQLDLPAAALGVARVHPQERAGEERRLVAAGAGAHLEEHVARVVRVLRQQRGLEFARERLHARARRRALVLGERLHRRIGRHLVGRREVGLGVPPGAEPLDDRPEFRVLLRERAEAVHVGRRLRRGQRVVELGQARDEAFEAGAEGELHRGRASAGIGGSRDVEGERDSRR